MPDNRHTEEKSRSQKQKNSLKSFKQIIQLGKFLFRYRAIIATPFFILLVILSKPTNVFTLAIISFLIGIGIRIWAAGYIGIAARSTKFSGQFVITNGPYKYLKHPLYLGNFFLVFGVIILFNPTIWFALLLIFLFIFEYAIIIISEMNYLKNLPKKEVRFALTNCRTETSTIIIMLLIFLIYLGKWKLS